MSEGPVMSEGPIARLLREKRVLVCCGAGGVGKTTVSASLALAAARAGRRVLVVTIDPSRRLAESLGVSRNPEAPVMLDAERLRAVGVEPPGTLSAWMLDPQLVSDKVVHSFSKSDTDARDLLANPIYRNVTSMVAGMQEYTAVEALYTFVQDDTYDLVVLDTPPSRNALRFLEAPSRAVSFLDKRVFNLFVADDESSTIRKMAVRLLESVMDRAFGRETREQLQQFFHLFGGILDYLNHNQHEMRRFFTEPSVGFLLVTSPAQEALTEAFWFERKTRDELGLPLVGYILNRSLAWATGRPLPSEVKLPADAPEALVTGLRKLEVLAKPERQTVDEHLALSRELQSRAGERGLAWVLPQLPQGASELEALVGLADALVAAAPPVTLAG